MTQIYDPLTDPDNDDWMFEDTPTGHARTALVQRLIDNHEPVVSGRVACNEAPLIVKGGLADGRIFLFRARHGRASLAIAVPDQQDQPAEHVTACPDLLNVDDINDAANTFAQLMRAFHLA